jgi:periplasmic protein TonB
MFEQSLLLDPAAGKKTGALAASLTLQTLAVGVMIAIPLVYSDRLPVVPRFISLSLPAPPPPPPPGESPHADTARSSRSSIAPARIFVAPRRIADLSQISDVGIVDAPPAYVQSSDGVPGSTGIAPIIGQLFRETFTPPKATVAEPAKVPAKPVPIGGVVQSAKLVKKVIPVYPPLARQARVSGTVQLIGVIAKDGTIQQLQVVGGHPLLVKAALDAVRQWIYRPTLLNGQSVEVIAPIDVIFNLSN